MASQLLRTVLSLLGARPSRPGPARRPPGHQSHRLLRKGPSANRGPRSHGEISAFHGTPSSANAASIFRNGWMVGSGNALGDGIYFARDRATAKSYAGGSGVYLHCRVRLGRTCQWDVAMQQRYANWCQSRAVAADNSAITAFLLQHGFDTLQNGPVIVVLAPRFANPTAWKQRVYRIRILSVHRATDDTRIRV